MRQFANGGLTYISGGAGTVTLNANVLAQLTGAGFVGWGIPL